MARNSITVVPLIGVLIALITFAVSDLASIEVQVRGSRFETQCGPDERTTVVRVQLHADASAELDIDGLRRYVDAPRLSAAVRTSVDEHADAIYLDPDSNTSWQQVIDTTSSLANASGLRVALVTAPDPK